MKRVIFVLCLLLAGMSLQAKVVSVERARSNAAAFFAKAMPQTKAPVTADAFRLIGTYPETGTKAMVEPAMYFLGMEGGGYVVVSADDVARPILGWSLDEDFPGADMPDNMRAMLDWYAQVIEYARSQGWAAAADSSGEVWDEANSVVLQTAQWSQWSPYNDLVPEISGQKPPIGCVATAISIVMRYHQWPQKGTGTLPAYDYHLDKYGDIHIDGVQLGHEYDWSKMPLKASGFTQEESAQIARLLYDVAVMCEMQFEPGGSSAFLFSALGLSYHFGYDKSITCCDRSWIDGVYTDIEWENTIKNEIDASRPVLYDGFTEESGHAFVIDGYNGRYFHINYGWGGGTTSRNGHDKKKGAFYSLTPIEGHEGDLLTFNLYQDMVCGIMPDRGGEGYAQIFCNPRGAIGVPSDFELGKDFPIRYTIRKVGQGNPKLEMVLAICNSDGKVKQLASEPVIVEKNYNSVQFNANISGPPEEGDALIIMSRKSGEQDWSPVPMGRNAKIVFTKRPLSELVEIGYIEHQMAVKDDDTPPLHFYMEIYKDLIWGISSTENQNDYWFGSESYTYLDPSTNAFKTFSGEWIVESVLLGTGDDTEHIEFSLPHGDYILHLENPATGEIMDVNLKL